MEPLRLNELLKTAADPTRLRILNLLLHGSICVCNLQAILNVPQPTVSRHLAALRRAGLVLDHREGPRVVYSIAPAATSQHADFLEFLTKVCPTERSLRKDLRTMEQARGDPERAVSLRHSPTLELKAGEVQHPSELEAS